MRCEYLDTLSRRRNRKVGSRLAIVLQHPPLFDMVAHGFSSRISTQRIAANRHVHPFNLLAGASWRGAAFAFSGPLHLANPLHNPYAKMADRCHPQTVNGSPIYKYLTLLALRTTARFYQGNGLCVPISRGLIVKKGAHINPAEVATVGFVAAQTTIPVPRVFCSFTHRNSTHIVMERIRGATLADARPSLTEEDIERILVQLRSMIAELRASPAPGTAIQSCAGGPLYDARIPRSTPAFGPFPSIPAFHSWSRDDIVPGQKLPHVDDEKRADIQDMIALQDGQEWDAPVFTHGDLNPFNIIVHDGKIAAIIDWEFSGWLPPYWEYTSVWLGNKTRIAWQDLAVKFVDPWPNELRMETIRQKWWGDL